MAPEWWYNQTLEGVYKAEQSCAKPKHLLGSYIQAGSLDKNGIPLCCLHGSTPQLPFKIPKYRLIDCRCSMTYPKACSNDLRRPLSGRKSRPFAPDTCSSQKNVTGKSAGNIRALSLLKLPRRSRASRESQVEFLGIWLPAECLLSYSSC